MSNEIKNHNKRRKIFLDELPRWRDGTNKGRINWKQSVGFNIDFIYEDISGYFTIIDYNKKVLVKYNNEEFLITTNSIISCSLGLILKKLTRDFRIKKETSIKDDKRDLTITDTLYKINEYGQHCKYYLYKCNKCGYDKGEISESNLLTLKRGCPCCSIAPKVVVDYINSIYATDPWMIDLGISEEDAKGYLKTSNEKITVKCPTCGKQKKINIYNVFYRKSINCSCGDGKKYPEKFIMGFLNQLNIDYETEYTPHWSNRKRYDFHIGSNNSIIESHGSQHPGTKHHDDEGFGGCSNKARTPQQELENDIYKEQLAKENGIENYIVIDCSLSDMEFIKDNILNSRLAELYDLSNINWLECEKFALSNRVKEVCDYWNQKEEWETATDLAVIFKINRGAIVKYLKKGTLLNWCKYDSKEELAKRSARNNKTKRKRVSVYKNGIMIGEPFDSITKLASLSKEIFGIDFKIETISRVCNGKSNKHKGYVFKYTDE